MRSARKPIVLVRTDFRTMAGSAGEYNSMSPRRHGPARPAGRSTTEVAAAILDALAGLETS